MFTDPHTALQEAALAAFKTHGTLADSVGRAILCENFLRRWLMTSESPLVIDPTAASGSYFFLLWKNLSVTNVSVAELMALLRRFAKDRISNADVQVDFIATDNYKAFLNDLWESFFVSEEFAAEDVSAYAEEEEAISGTPRRATSGHPTSRAKDMGERNIDDLRSLTPEIEVRVKKTTDQILQFHGTFFRRTIIFDSYFTSVLIHIPLSLKIDVASATIQSGYVHSSGVALYFRKIEKAEQSKLVSRLGNYLGLHNGTRFFITPYAWEFFSPFEQKSAVSIRNGLDGVRMYLAKHFFEKEPLLNFISQLREYFESQLSIPAGVRDYTEDRRQSLQEGATSDCTIWFVTDSGYTFDQPRGVTSKNKNIYIVAYAQTHLNYNQLNIFKERKPGWVSSTTLPHTLSGAMVNIARHQWDLTRQERSRSLVGIAQDNKPIIVDPFCGTGTTLFDSLARFEDAAVIGLDQSPVMPNIVRNNLEFFALDVEQISVILSSLRAISGWIRRRVGEGQPDSIFSQAIEAQELPSQRIPERDFAHCLHLLLNEINAGSIHTSAEVSDAAVSRVDKEGFSPSIIGFLESQRYPLILKIYFYLQWRAVRMNTFSIRTEARTANVILQVLLDELDRSVKEFEALEQLLERNVLRDSQPFRECKGSYSREGAFHPDFFSKTLATQFVVDEGRLTRQFIERLTPGLTIARVDDAVAVLERLPEIADIVITDPPYGFNAFESESEDMKLLYARMIPAVVNALRPWGQLMLSLPAYAKNGKQIPFYQTRESVIKQIIAAIESKNRKIIRCVETCPAGRDLYWPPWYWGTASTIERRVVHFVVG